MQWPTALKENFLFYCETRSEDIISKIKDLSRTLQSAATILFAVLGLELNWMGLNNSKTLASILCLRFCDCELNLPINLHSIVRQGSRPKMVKMPEKVGGEKVGTGGPPDAGGKKVWGRSP